MLKSELEAVFFWFWAYFFVCFPVHIVCYALLSILLGVSGFNISYLHM